MSSTASEIDGFFTAADLPQRLRRALAQAASGKFGRTRMGPEMSYGRHAGPAPITARQAAVMLLLFRRDDEWHLPLTERPASLMRHGGQISLPGGAVDMGETASQAALRELDEELGFDADVEMLGQLAECYVFASDFVITPCVGAVDFAPQWKPHAWEVQGIVELPLAALFDPRSVGTTTIERGPLTFRAPCWQVAGACVWGATAVILDQLAGILRRAQQFPNGN
jgi:8-oxo-dGTP pyrophosphatase MutT (NUDIX family)